jgi:hypothetical protein
VSQQANNKGGKPMGEFIAVLHPSDHVLHVDMAWATECDTLAGANEAAQELMETAELPSRAVVYQCVPQ